MQPLETSQHPIRRPAASAYANSSGWLKSSSVVITTFLLLFILHNLLFQDYRGEIISQLKGQLSDEEIERFVPTLISEKRRKGKLGMAEMQKEIDRLNTEMKQVRQVLNETLLSMGKKPLESYSDTLRQNQ